MKLIGLGSRPGVGKDTIADYLVETHGFTKFSFSDALYAEAAAAFGISTGVLYKRSSKETPLECLQYDYCRDPLFQNIMFAELAKVGKKFARDAWCSPRQITQWWGTEYRRAQDPEYWIKKAEALLVAYLELATEDPSTPRAGLVNSSVRFPNEAAFIKKWNGEVWHLRREGYDVSPDTAAHIAERGLEVQPEDKVIVNNGTIEQLRTAATLMLASAGGTQIATAPTLATSEFVTCVGCGWVHMGYTRAEAEQEVEKFNAWYAVQDAETQSHYGGPASVEKTYTGCQRCGGTAFRMMQRGDAPEGCTIGPVIVE